MKMDHVDKNLTKLLIFCSLFNISILLLGVLGMPLKDELLDLSILTIIIINTDN